MAISKWLCTNGTKNMLVKIVHPGGHIELHDRPVLAGEIMLRNPRCCVTYPHVFKQPWAIVPPETMLTLGQKFYIVPVSTIRKLQKLSKRRCPSPLSKEVQILNKVEEEGKESNCCLFGNQSTPKPKCNGVNQSDNDEGRETKEMETGGCSSDDNCFACLLTGGNKIKPGTHDSSEERSSTPIGPSSETKLLTKKRSRDYLARKSFRGSPKRQLSVDNWQPKLESISEE